MLNRFEALKIFCSAAETLQFKETAQRLAVSAPVVSRVIAELEAHLGEALFQRNTRQVRLTDFGERFLPQALRLLEDSEALFAHAHSRREEEMAGLVRIALPEWPHNDAILADLLAALAPYPDITLDWRIDSARVNVVEAQIDVGLRLGFPADSRLIVKPLGAVEEKIVIAPALLAKLGAPRDFEELQQHYPLIDVVNPNTGRAWPWMVNDEIQFSPRRSVFLSNDIYACVQAAVNGLGVVQALHSLCAAHLRSGALQELFADVAKTQWPMYLYRPQHNVTPARVKKVFALLADIVPRQQALQDKS